MIPRLLWISQLNACVWEYGDLVTPFNACDAIAMDLSGKVALVQRGECNFVQKVWNAQRANATAVIVIDSHLREECVLYAPTVFDFVAC